MLGYLATILPGMPDHTPHLLILRRASLIRLARHALPHVLEGSVLPVALFYGGLKLLGLHGALGAALAWAYAALGWRLARRQRVPGLLLLSVAGLTARTAVALATGSVLVYFLQPALGTVLAALAFLISVPLRRPLAQRLATDFLPLPERLLTHPLVHRFFLRISLLWALVLLANAGVGLWLLVSQPLATFLWARTSASLALTALGVALSTASFTRCLRRLRAAGAWPAPARLPAPARNPG